jgi:endonuclease/exonuclease/phosphatase family metal-dependent hydrolase
MVNLVREHNVQSTRTSFYTKPDKFADYVFVTPDISVRNFKVLPDEVSDHAALYVEF